MVLGVCRRVLHDHHAAEDAWQATFLVLARKAGSLERPAALGPWLHGVALRTALKARALAARRHVCERRAATPEAEPPDDLVWRDLRPVLDEAIGSLPEKYRVPFVLHYLEGRTVAAVARELGCPRGTVGTRLARARERLRSRLAGRGLALSAGVLGLALSRAAASAAPPLSLVSSVVEAATLFAAGQAAAGGLVSARAAALAQGGLKAMHLTRLTSAVVAATALIALGLGVGAGLRRAPAAAPKDPRVAVTKPAGPMPAPVPATRKQVQISITIFQGDPHGSREAGTLKALAEPTLVTEDGCPCSFMAGGVEVVYPGDPRKTKGIPVCEAGRSIRITPTLGKENGTVFLDVTMEDSKLTEHLHAVADHLIGTIKLGEVVKTVEDSKLAEYSGDRIRLHTVADRVIGTFKLGEVIKLEETSEAGKPPVWAELVLREVQPLP
jgi:RNA polymerase sigma factor (sigma-70 family)